MNSRPLNKGEALELSKLNTAGIDSVLVYLTDTGLRKSILDATDPLRELLQGESYHNYSQQEPGGAKVYKEVTLFSNEKPLIASFFTRYVRTMTLRQKSSFLDLRSSHPIQS